MPSDTAFGQSIPAQPRDTSLPAGAGLALAVVLGMGFWAGLFAVILL